MIRSLPQGWGHIKLHLTHAQDIKTSDDVVHHLDLGEDHLASLSVKMKFNQASSILNKKFKKKNKRSFKGKGKKDKVIQVQTPMKNMGKKG